MRFTDKQWALGLASSLGIEVPRQMSADDITYPCFFKSAVEGGPRLRGIARSSRDLPPAAIEVIFQEYVPGFSTIGVPFLAEQGELLAHHVYDEAHSIPATGGSAVLIRPLRGETAAAAAAATARIVAASDYCGWGLAEFKLGSSGELFFMEINPKFWASLEFTLRTQVEFGGLLFGRECAVDGPSALVFPLRAMRRGPAFVWRERVELRGAKPSRDRRAVSTAARMAVGKVSRTVSTATRSIRD